MKPEDVTLLRRYVMSWLMAAFGAVAALAIWLLPTGASFVSSTFTRSLLCFFSLTMIYLGLVSARRGALRGWTFVAWLVQFAGIIGSFCVFQAVSPGSRASTFAGLAYMALVVVLAWFVLSRERVSVSGAGSSFLDGGEMRVVPVAVGLVIVCLVGVPLLLRAGIRAFDIDHAVGSGQAKRARALLEKHPEYLTERGAALLSAAVKRGHLQIARLLLDKGVPVDARDGQGPTPLFVAAEAGRQDLVKFFLSRGAQVNAVDKGRLTPLHAAAWAAAREATELLLRSGAKVNARTAEGCTALHYAARRGRQDVVGPLLAQGAAVNVRDDRGLTPLHGAAFIGSVEVARLLIKHGADVDVLAEDGDTPLIVAARWGHAGVVRALLAAGADDAIQNRKGNTAFDYALESGAAQVAELLREHATRSR